MHSQTAKPIRLSHQHQQQQFAHQPQLDNSSFFTNLDPSAAAKQLAALNVANMTRIANNGRPPHAPSQPFLSPASASDTLPSSHPGFNLHQTNGLAPFPTSSSLPDSPLPANQPSPHRNPPPQSIATSLKQRRRGFLAGLASVLTARNTPLPPALTGVPYPPNYDPTTSSFKFLEISTHEHGFFRLAGKDIDIFKLWGLVFQAGGGAKLNTEPGAWNTILLKLDLPEHFPAPRPDGQTSVAAVLAQHYMTILHPFEDAYKRNLQEQQRRAAVAAAAARSNQAQIPAQRPNTTNSSLNGNLYSHPPPRASSQPPHLAPPGGVQPNTDPGVINHPPGFTNHSSETDVLDPETQGIKRKLDSEEADSKRARQKTAEPESSDLSADRSSLPRPTSAAAAPNDASTKVPPTVRPRPQPTRRKIEYVPLGREIETYGGRDMNAINDELTRNRDRRPLREINDWGIVDIEALTMSLRSRLSTELSYALTTFTLLSTMKGPTPGSGFPIKECVDLLDEVLDLLEEEAFGDQVDSEPDISQDLSTATHRELINIVHEDGSQPFAPLKHGQGSKNPNLGPRQRPGNYVLSVTNIIRNLSTVKDNEPFLVEHPRLLNVMLRVCDMSFDGSRPCATSPALSLADLIIVRKDTLYTLSNLAPILQLASHAHSPATTKRVARRAFSLVSSYLIDPAGCLSPALYLQQSGNPAIARRPPSLLDTALEVLTQLSKTDSNRQVLSQVLPQMAIWRLFEALVHRLPVLDADFQLVTRDHWLSYLEKVVLSIYSLAFLAPPDLKQKIKTDRKLCFSKVMLRVVYKCLSNSSAEARSWFAICTRRAVEAMKVVDDGKDLFDTSQPTTMAAMSFGMGYGEVGEDEKEKGTGMLGGYRELTWDLLMLREVDDVMFHELESLARVE